MKEILLQNLKRAWSQRERKKKIELVKRRFLLPKDYITQKVPKLFFFLVLLPFPAENQGKPKKKQKKKTGG